MRKVRINDPEIAMDKVVDWVMLGVLIVLTLCTIGTVGASLFVLIYEAVTDAG